MSRDRWLCVSWRMRHFCMWFLYFRYGIVVIPRKVFPPYLLNTFSNTPGGTSVVWFGPVGFVWRT